MKKIVLLFMLALAMLASAFSNDADLDGWFRPILGIQADYVFDNNVENIGPVGLGDTYAADGFMLFNIEAGVLLWQWVWFSIDTDTYTSPPGGNPYSGMFSPYQSDYGFKIGLQHWGVRIGYEHWCYHTVISSWTQYAKAGGVNEWFIDIHQSTAVDVPGPEKSRKVILDINSRFSYIPWYHSAIYNTGTGAMYNQYIENVLVFGIGTGMTFFGVVWAEVDMGVYMYGSESQYDMAVRAGLNFKGVRFGYEYKAYTPTEDIVPIRGWYGNTQSVFIGFDINNVYRSS